MGNGIYLRQVNSWYKYKSVYERERERDGCKGCWLDGNMAQQCLNRYYHQLSMMQSNVWILDTIVIHGVLGDWKQSSKLGTYNTSNKHLHYQANNTR